MWESFVKYDCFSQIISLGYNQRELLADFNHSVEFSYDTLGVIKGLFGSPFRARYVFNYVLSPMFTLKMKLDLSKDMTLDCAKIIAFNSNFRLVLSDRISLSNLVHEPAKSGYSIGTMLEFSF